MRDQHHTFQDIKYYITQSIFCSLVNWKLGKVGKSSMIRMPLPTCASLKRKNLVYWVYWIFSDLTSMFNIKIRWCNMIVDECLHFTEWINTVCHQQILQTFTYSLYTQETHKHREIYCNFIKRYFHKKIF